MRFCFVIYLIARNGFDWYASRKRLSIMSLHPASVERLRCHCSSTTEALFEPCFEIHRVSGKHQKKAFPLQHFLFLGGVPFAVAQIQHHKIHLAGSEFPTKQQKRDTQHIPSPHHTHLS